MALALGFGVGTASGCDPGPFVGVSITSHQGGETLRGTAVPVYGTASATPEGLKFVRAALQSIPETDLLEACPASGSWCVYFDTTEIANGANKSLGATAFDCDDPRNTASTGPIWVTISNHYLCDVVRGHESSVGSLRWKRLNDEGDGWVSVAGPWNAITEGAGPDTCEHKADTGSRHDMCTNKDTPAYLQSDAQDPKSYPSIGAVRDSWDGDDPPGYTTDTYEGHVYYVVIGSGNVVGRYVVLLPNQSGRCHTTAPYSDCWRTGIQIHGGYPTTDFETALADTQDLKATHGCIRMHNANLATLVENYIEVYQPRVGGCIHISVPDI